MKSSSLSISIVVHQSDLTVLEETVISLARSFLYAGENRTLTHGSLTIIDNGTDRDYYARLHKKISRIWERTAMPLSFIKGHGNIGYGRGHNLGIFSSACRYHLVLNPDVVMEQNALANALGYMDEQDRVGLLVPRVMGSKGENLHLIKRYPALFTLLLRGIQPFIKDRAFFRSIIKNPMARHDLTDRNWDALQLLDKEMASGCFMLFRTESLKQINGFSPEFFLYFEDYDISRRINEIASTVYHPDVSIVHFGGSVSKKGFWHILQYIRSGVKFFSKYGWRFF